MTPADIEKAARDAEANMVRYGGGYMEIRSALLALADSHAELLDRQARIEGAGRMLVLSKPGPKTREAYALLQMELET